MTLYRDVWGVPHVYADNAADGVYGLGYAMAEDRLDDVYTALRTGLGSMSEAFGKKYVEQDYIMRLCRNEELAKESWENAPEHLRAIGEGFCAGIQAYVDEHPEHVPEFAIELEPWKFLTVARAMILRWPLGTIQDDVKNGKKGENVPMRSNQWSVSPARSADGRAILLSDPHLTWEGLAVLYEARVHAGELHMNGYFVIGSPLMGIGHNQHVGWANTTGGPDTSDVYEIKLKLGFAPQYEYDGEWRKAELKMISIPVKDGDPVRRPAIYTHLGPLVSQPDLKNGTALVGASPYFNSMRLLEQFYEMNTAKSAREVFEALGMNQYNEQNMMFADVNGTIAYLRSGATPIRPDGYNWDAPVPGDTSATAWKGIHPVDDLVHIFNPPAGYMQNCNISPANMMVDSPLTPDKYPDYIYNVSWDQNNPRGKRSTQLLHDDDSVTPEEAEAFVTDVYDILSGPWQEALRQAVEAVGRDRLNDPQFAAMVKAILDWDGQFTADATPTTLYKLWRLKCGDQIEVKRIGAGEPLTNSDREKMLDLLAETAAEMQDRYGRWDVAWGEVHKVGRGGKLFPVGGADFRSGDREGNHSETLFDVSSKDDPDHPDHYIAKSGSMSMILMFFGPDGIESKTCVCWGQSGRPESPHYVDQAEHLYSQRKLKPTFWKKEDLLKNLESEKVLVIR